MDTVFGLLGAIFSLGTYVLPLIIIVGGTILLNMLFRTVVPTNTVHIVQRKKKTTSYGTNMEGGNVYMVWPSWVPFIGITKVEYPVSNFNLNLKDYAAYDKDRVPFTIDITAFFRISDTNKAAQRISNFKELHDQLEKIVQGAVRKILASVDINQVMTERSTFGDKFTEEVRTELSNWGVEPVKSMELMDIRDADGSKVIANIMAKKQSHIQMESRIEVAANMQKAETAEIEAKQAVDIRAQEAAEQVGKRTAEKDKAVGIATEQAQQEIKEQAKITAEKDMAVKQVAQVRQAEITMAEQVVAAEQDKKTRITKAEGERDAAEKLAEATRLKGKGEADAQQAKLLAEAEGLRASAMAKADGEKAMQMAPIDAQVTLAKEIGANPNYQQYLISIRAIEAQVSVGTAQAAALTHADVKVIANTGNSPTEGFGSVMDLFTSKGGLNLGAALAALGNVPEGKAVLEKLGVTSSDESKPTDVTPPAAKQGKPTANGTGAHA